MRRSAIVMMGIAILFVTSSFAKTSNSDPRAIEVNLMIRQIGHRLLLQAGDSTSTVMPVTEISEGTFRLEFENPFVFNHDSLFALSQSLLPKSLFPLGYSVLVLDCLTANIVYGFKLNNYTPDLLSCRGRNQPSGCYAIEFSFPDLYEKDETNSDIAQLKEEPRSIQVDRQDAKLKLAELKTTASNSNMDQRTAKLSPIKVESSKPTTKPQASETTTSDFSLTPFIYSSIVLLGVTLLIGHFRKRLSPVSTQNRQTSAIKVSAIELPAIGKFLFDVQGQRLLFGTETITLTDKECKVLELLNHNFGELTPREMLMQRIWINEGVITSRSLDMFVSKLRKKLSSDPELRITNVHGKGYKLEMAGT